MSLFHKALFVASISLIVLGGVVGYQAFRFYDGKLHVVFCNVGQGDGIFIRTPKGLDILIDGGPDGSILDCIGKHTPFWDRSIEVMILTHPHADHLNGLLSVLERYTVKHFFTEQLTNESAGFKVLMERIREKKVPLVYVLSGNSLKTKDGLRFTIVGPSMEFLSQTSPNGKIGESKEFASVEVLLSFGSFTALFTGDSQAEEIKNAVDLYRMRSIDIFQIPHHGSRTGITRELLDLLSPELAVISVGKNKYGHPTQEVLQLLNQTKTKYLRTDQNGSVEVVSDGKNMSLR